MIHLNRHTHIFQLSNVLNELKKQQVTSTDIKPSNADSLVRNCFGMDKFEEFQGSDRGR